MLIECSWQHYACAEGQCWNPCRNPFFTLFVKLVTEPERNIHQTIGGLRRAVGGEIGEVPPAAGRVTDTKISCPVWVNAVLKREIALIDVDAVMLAVLFPVDGV